MKVVRQLYEKTGEEMSPFKVSVDIDTITNKEIDNMFNKIT